MQKIVLLFCFLAIFTVGSTAYEGYDDSENVESALELAKKFVTVSDEETGDFFEDADDEDTDPEDQDVDSEYEDSDLEEQDSDSDDMTEDLEEEDNPATTPAQEGGNNAASTAAATKKTDEITAASAVAERWKQNGKSEAETFGFIVGVSSSKIEDHLEMDQVDEDLDDCGARVRHAEDAHAQAKSDYDDAKTAFDAATTALDTAASAQQNGYEDLEKWQAGLDQTDQKIATFRDHVFHNAGLKGAYEREIEKEKDYIWVLQSDDLPAAKDDIERAKIQDEIAAAKKFIKMSKEGLANAKSKLADAQSELDTWSAQKVKDSATFHQKKTALENITKQAQSFELAHKQAKMRMEDKLSKLKNTRARLQFHKTQCEALKQKQAALKQNIQSMDLDQHEIDSLDGSAEDLF